MGMTNEQFKAYVAGLLDELEEFEEMRKHENEAVKALAETKIKKIIKRLHEALER
ncbi:MAG: hypothetical protein FWF59_08870 [Turicibacter sp.]|nr:hypothetical protein [Turicibacter sp.]